MSTPIRPSIGPSGIEQLFHSDKPAASVRHTGRIDRWLVAHLQRSIAPAAVRLELWDGSSPYDDSATPLGSLVIHDRRTLIGLALHPDLQFGESYMAGRLEVRGPLEPVVEALTRLSQPHTTWRDRLTPTLPNTLSASRRNVHSHYDLGNDFYQLWLDRHLVYTCAYYANEQMSLDEAQLAKLDLVCRKLRLRRGERVLETGCGWGALALHMARHYGVHVRAFNLSPEQLSFARERAAREGLTNRVEFIDEDYRNVTGQVRCVRLGRDARARRPASPPDGRRGASPHDSSGRRPRAAALHRTRCAHSAQRLGPPTDLPRRIYTHHRRSRHAHAGAGRHVDHRHRESPAALRAHAGPLERALRAGQGPRATGVRR